MNIKLEGMKIPISEKPNGSMTQQDMMDTNDEMYKVNCEMADMIKGMTLDERKNLNEVIAKMNGSLKG